MLTNMGFELPEITSDNISDYLVDNGYENQSLDEEYCQSLADRCNDYFADYVDAETIFEIPTEDEMIEKVFAEELKAADYEKKDFETKNIGGKEMDNSQKEMLKASPELTEEGKLFYNEEFSLGNLYYLLYYNFNDANDTHFSNVAASIADEKEMLNNCVALVKTVCSLEGICEKDFFEKYDFPESVKSAVNEVKAAIYKPEKTIDSQER